MQTDRETGHASIEKDNYREAFAKMWWRQPPAPSWHSVICEAEDVARVVRMVALGLVNCTN